MAREIDKYKQDLVSEVVSYTELENYMYAAGYVLVETDDGEKDGIIRFTNFKREIWVYGELDDGNNILVTKITSSTKKKGEYTKSDPFYSYQDLEKVLNYFKDRDKWHHWLAGWLCVALGRRIGDTLSLKWSDVYNQNGTYKSRITTLKEEKTGKVLGVRINALAQAVIDEYRQHCNIRLDEVYNRKIFSTGAAAFRAALKEAVNVTEIQGNISTHSSRKFYANTLYKLHDSDMDNLKVIQTILGHSSEEITKIYIGEIDRKIDKYNADYADYLLGMMQGKEMELDHSPIVRLRANDFRQLLTEALSLGAMGGNNLDGFNKLLKLAEEKML